MIALVNAVVVGGLGTAFAYMLIGLPWTVNNVLCLIAMVFLVWMGSMIGYSKIIETFRQFRVWQDSVKKGEDPIESLDELRKDIENL